MSRKPRSGVPASFFLPAGFREGLPFSMLVANEIRAALPVWLIGMALVSTGFIPFGEAAGVLGYTVGCCALGAVMAGHDFTHRTLSFTLSQPVSREALWRLRMRIALAGMIPIAWVALFQPHTFGFLTPGGTNLALRLLVFAGPLLIGLTVVPPVVLFCRSSLAGTVFCVWIFLGVAYATDLLTVLRFGQNPLVIPDPLAAAAMGNTALDFVLLSDLLRFHASVQSLLLLSLSVGGYLIGRRLFFRLEATEPRARQGFGSTTRQARERATRPTTPRPGWWQLVWKECRLHQLVLLPATGLAISLMLWQNRENAGSYPIQTAFWACFLCVLLGGMGSAEERQLGVVPSQALLRIARWKQGLIKVTVPTVLALWFVLAIPGFLMHWGPWKYPASLLLAAGWTATPAIFALVVVSFYISSLSSRTLHSILLSVGVGGSMITLLFSPMLAGFSRPPDTWIEALAEPRGVAGAVPWIVLTAAMAVLAVSAVRNHFSLEQTAGRMFRQVAGAAAVALFVLLGVFDVGKIPLAEPYTAAPLAAGKVVRHQSWVSGLATFIYESRSNSPNFRRPQSFFDSVAVFCKPPRQR